MPGYPRSFAFATMMDLAYEVPVCMEEVMDEYADLPGMADLREHMLGPVRENCQRTLDLIKADMGGVAANSHFPKEERGTHRKSSGAPSHNVICNPLARGSDCC